MNALVDGASRDGGIPEVAVTKQGRFSIIWIIPLIAAGIGGWLAYKSYADRGVPITITFSDGTGIAGGKTQVRYKGLTVGQVDSVRLGSNDTRVVVHATLEKSVGGLARGGSQFWVVRPRIGQGHVSGLGTILSGEYIQVRPGKGARATSFTGLEEPPLIDEDSRGLRLILKTDQLGSLQAGAPVYYREVVVGSVSGCRLTDAADGVNVYAFIEENYAPLVRENTRFWNASGVDVKLGLLSGLDVNFESLRALLAGGIAFATPDNRDMGTQVSDGAVFTLYREPNYRWLTWKPKIPLGAGEGN